MPASFPHAPCARARTGSGWAWGLFAFSLLALSPAPGLFAQGSHEVRTTLEELSADIKNLQELIASKGQTAQSVQGEIHRLDLETSLARKQLELATQTVDSAEGNLLRLRERITELETSIHDSRAEIRFILRRLYRSRVPGTLRLLLASDNPSDLTATQGYLAYFARKDSQRLESFKQLLSELAGSRAEQERELERVTRLKDSVAVHKENLERKLGQRKKFLSQLHQDRKAYLANLDGLEEAARKLRVMLEGLGEGAPVDSGPDMVAIPFPSLKGLLTWPHKGPLLRRFGRQVNRSTGTVTISKGIDILGAPGEEVRSIYSGLVRKADWFEGYGKLIVIEHSDRYFSLYAHLSDVLVSKDEYVRKNQLIGLLGDTGSTEGFKLHLEIRQKVEPQDPISWLRPERRR